jgi:formate-dependent nitrite reductase membrane component NrfD
MVAEYRRNWREGGRRKHQTANQDSERHRTAAQAARSSYYGVPPIHKPHWNWLIVLYFFLGGISGGSYAIASIAELTSRKHQQHVDIVRAGRVVSFLALLPCPVLLIFDLGRPERFYRMLRVVKLRSPMSVGTWGLLLFSAFSTISLAMQLARDGDLGHSAGARLLARLPIRTIGIAGAIPGFVVSGYTGVLLGATAVPLWAKNALLLGPLFIASALSSAASAITLVLALCKSTTPAALHRVESVEKIAKVAEAGLLVASWVRLGSTAKPLTQGEPGKSMALGAVGLGIVAPTLLQAVNKGRLRPFAIAASLFTLVGGYALRHAVVKGGLASADDPQATFDFTMDRIRARG